MRGKKIIGRAIRLVGCAGVGVVGVVIDVPALCGIAVAKSPILLWKGWKQQIVNMEACVEEGICPRPICLPLTGAMLLLWPATVAASIGSAVLYSLKKGLYGAVVAYREESIGCGLKHVVAAIAEYDEFTNDVALLREGSCLPRPNYHKQQHEQRQKKKQESNENQRDQQDGKKVRVHVIREFELTRLLKFLTSSYAREKGKRLVESGFIAIGNGNKLSAANLESSVAFTILCFLLHSAAELQAQGKGQDSADGLVDGDESFVMYDPLETLERQIRDAKLQTGEEQYLAEIVLLLRASSRGAESDAQDPLRRATLQGFGRRIRGIAAFVSRDVGFRRQFSQYVYSVLADLEDMISFD